MKKLLSLLMLSSLTTSATLSVVACGGLVTKDINFNLGENKVSDFITPGLITKGISQVAYEVLGVFNLSKNSYPGQDNSHFEEIKQTIGEGVYEKYSIDNWDSDKENPLTSSVDKEVLKSFLNDYRSPNDYYFNNISFNMKEMQPFNVKEKEVQLIESVQTTVGDKSYKTQKLTSDPVVSNMLEAAELAGYVEDDGKNFDKFFKDNLEKMIIGKQQLPNVKSLETETLDYSELDSSNEKDKEKIAELDKKLKTINSGTKYYSVIRKNGDYKNTMVQSGLTEIEVDPITFQIDFEAGNTTYLLEMTLDGLKAMLQVQTGPASIKEENPETKEDGTVTEKLIASYYIYMYSFSESIIGKEIPTDYRTKNILKDLQITNFNITEKK